MRKWKLWRAPHVTRRRSRAGWSQENPELLAHSPALRALSPKWADQPGRQVKADWRPRARCWHFCTPISVPGPQAYAWKSARASSWKGGPGPHPHRPKRGRGSAPRAPPGPFKERSISGPSQTRVFTSTRCLFKFEKSWSVRLPSAGTPSGLSGLPSTGRSCVLPLP